MKKIKLLVDAHVFDAGFQGTTCFIEGLYNELVKEEVLEIYLAAHNIEKLKEHFSDGRFHFIQLKTTNRYRRLLLEFPSVIKKHKIDYAHFQYIVPPVKSCCYIVTIHDLLFRDFPDEFPSAYRFQKDLFFKRAARKADILTTVSNYSAQSLEYHYGIPKEQVILTPNAVPAMFFEDHDKLNSQSFIRSEYGIENFLLYVARIEPRKNHDLLIRAFRDLNLNDLQLVLIGQRSISSPGLHLLLKELPGEVKARIRWFEKIPQHHLLHFYNAARLFVFPSKAEGFGIPPLEAAVLKTPVLCSGVTAMQDFDFFEDDLFDPLDEAGFKNKLRSKLANPPTGDRLSKISRAICKKYNWEFAAGELFKTIMASFNR